MENAVDLGADRLPRTPGLPDPRREARWLLAAAWGRDETWLLVNRAAALPEAVEQRYLSWVDRRAAGEPAHHLTGLCPFWGRDFRVTPRVLVPRPETELLVQAALDLPLPATASVLDVGTGSGCIAVTLAAERPAWRVTATDLSLAAAAVAADNARRHGVDVGVVCCDLSGAVDGRADLVTANLPYVPSRDLERLPVEVRHDPVLALDGGQDGLGIVRRLLRILTSVLAPGGRALLELGENQAAEIARLAVKAGLDPAGTVCDPGGCKRVFVVRSLA